MGNSSQIESELKNYIIQAVKRSFDLEIESAHVEHPEKLIHGDFSTNISLILAPRLQQSPIDIAKKLAYEMNENPLITKINGQEIKTFKFVEVAVPGFINFVFNPDWLVNVLKEITLGGKDYGSSDFWQGSRIIIEYTDPNPFKIFHAGHLMTNAIGESLARIFEFCGAEVKRANYQGDVGIHVANSIWGLIKKMAKDNLTLVDLQKMSLKKRMEYLGQAYSLGATAYEEDESAQQQIKALNSYVYVIAQKMLVEDKNWDATVDYSVLTEGLEPPFNLDLITSLYKAGKKWSLDYFEIIYERLGTDFDYYYFESRAGEVGLQKVLDNVGNVFKRDQGAVIFEGEKHGLHTRVFVNSQGLPVYEAKDLGLATIKKADYDYDKSIIITANEVDEYFKVVLKAMEFVDGDLASKTSHIGHGMLVFKHGKMSSRTGDIISADDLLENINKKVSEKMTNSSEVEERLSEETSERVAVSSIKYSILKNGIGNDVVYDEEEATNLIGNTGPYLLYTYARTRSVLEKAGDITYHDGVLEDLTDSELEVLRHIYKFCEVVRLSCERLSPNLVAGFVFDLAQKYNTFYASEPILKASTEAQTSFRLYLTGAVGQVICNALNLLGIKVVDKM